MKTKFVAFCEAKNEDEAMDLCPWACLCVEVCEGFMMFESRADYDIWINQK